MELERLDCGIIINNDELFLGTAFLDENEAKEPKLIIDKSNFNLNIANEYENIDITEQKFIL